MAKTLMGIAVGVALAYVGFGALLFTFQRDQQYHPRGSIAVPASSAERGVALVTLTVPDGERIAAWYRTADPGHPTILYLPGNGGSVADSHDRFEDLIDEGFGLLGISYRGYPGSTGSPTEEGLFLDAEAGYDFLVENGVSAADVIVYGWSLGSGVATHLASRRSVGALVLEAPFLSAEAIARLRYPLYPIRLLMKDPFRSDLLLPDLTAPLVVVHGTEDRTIPFSHGREFVERYQGPKRLIEIPGGTHTNIWERGGWAKVRTALGELGALD